MSTPEVRLQVRGGFGRCSGVASVRRESSESEPVVLTRDAVGIITYVDEGITDMLGWTPEQLVGQPSTKFLHPEDQPAGIAMWMEMITEPGTKGTWRGRYRAADGSWQWVETVNENHLDGPRGGRTHPDDAW